MVRGAGTKLLLAVTATFTRRLLTSVLPEPPMARSAETMLLREVTTAQFTLVNPCSVLLGHEI